MLQLPAQLFDGLSGYFENIVMVIVYEAGGDSNGLCRLTFVAREHPHFDLCLSQIFNRLVTFFLQEIFQCSYTDQLQVHLQLALMAVLQLRLIGVGWKLLDSEHQCPQALKRQPIHRLYALLLKLPALIQSLYDGHVGSFDKVDDFASVFVLHDNTHTFSVACEFHNTDHLVPLFLSDNVDRDNVRVPMLERGESTVSAHLEERDFVHAGAGVAHLSRLLSVFVRNLELDGIVAHADASPQVEEPEILGL